MMLILPEFCWAGGHARGGGGVLGRLGAWRITIAMITLLKFNIVLDTQKIIKFTCFI